MTLRQKKLGVTEYGYERGIKQDEWLADHEAFLAKAATLKKGQYIGRDLFRQLWIKQMGDDFCFDIHYEYDIKPFLHGLSVVKEEYFNYTDTFGLDCLTIR